MAKRIQIRRDTAANWTSSNPILAQGEFGYETNTKKFKIGDGITSWSSLAYFTSGGAAALVDLTDVDDTNIGNDKILVYNSTSGKHEYKPLPTYQTVTIAVADWSGSTTCTKSVTGVTATSWNSWAFAESYRAKIIQFDVRPSAQSTNSVTFTADMTPDAEIVFNVEIK